MRLRYRVEADRIFLRIEDYVDNESRIWNMLKMMGAPLQVDSNPKALSWNRYVPKDAYPKLARSAQMLKAELLPEEGEAPLGAPTKVRVAYESARPFDVDKILKEANADPLTGLELLRGSRVRLAAWLRENPTFKAEAEADLRAIDGALDKWRAEREREKKVQEAAEARELSQALQGVAAEDVWRAHEAVKALKAAAERYAPQAKDVRTVKVPEQIPGFAGRLRHYQADGVRFILSRDLNGILADEMGLGKTIMAISSVLLSNDKALVVGPANVLYNWAAEVERFTGKPARVYHQQKRTGPREAQFMVTTYDALRTLRPDDPDVTCRPVLILDEAHYIRNPETLRARLVKSFPQRRRLLLTGTPLVNDIGDYYELLRQVQPERWGSREAFKEAWILDVSLFNKYAQVRTATAALLQQAARDVLLRRRKDEVLAELPPRTISITRHDLPPEEERVYRGLEARAADIMRESSSDVAVFAAIGALRQHLAKARVPAVLERVRELLEAEEAVVVYSHYLEPLHALKKDLGEAAAVLEGATPPKERQALSKTFGRDGGPRVLLSQMEAGGIGLNFTGGRHVLFLHFGWTPATHMQAMDRVHRIGQDRPVFVEFFVTPNTIDERMIQILLRKESDQNLVLADESDVFNRAALAKLLAEDAAKRAAAEKAVALRGDADAGLTSTD
ncbi:MAG TPA: DEAD/DEAH box helicase [Candidatus Thermoplasmatota archaeon]|nr:DEAD/DEAH box helicase [Candidatus Thermoplasmatota archaeon]